MATEILQGLMQRLSELESDFGGPASDVPALLDDLRTFEPGMIRQPAGAAQRALILVNRGDYSGAELAAVVESDPAIAQALLKHANATWYTDSEAPPLTSLVAAARRIGARGVHAAVMSVVMEAGFAQPGAGLDNLAKRVWDHMVRVAPMARQIGHGFGADADAAFTLGLCHDVGKLVLFERIADLRRRLRRDITFPRGFLKASMKSLDEPLGALAAVAWRLPSDFATVIASHHRDRPPVHAEPLSEAIFIAERLDAAMYNDKPLDLEELWKNGALETPFQTGRRIVELANRTAVQAALNEAAAKERA